MRILVSTSKNERMGPFVVSAISSLGHDKRLFIDDKSFSLSLFTMLTQSPFRQTAKRFLQSYKRKIGKVLLNEVLFYKPDLVIVVQGDYFLREDIKKIRDDYKIPVVNWLIHDPVLSEFYDPLRLINLADYSQLFIADELWWPCVYFFERKVTHLPLASDPHLYKPLLLEKEIDIFFTGNLLPPSPHTTTGLMYARVLEGLLKNNFSVHAAVSGKSMTKFFPLLAKLNFIKTKVSPETLNQLYNKSKIVLSLFPLDYKKNFPQQIFDVALSNSFQLVEYKDSVSKIFPDGIVSFKSQDELFGLLRKYLNSPEARRQLAEKAYDIALKQHTYQIRMRELLKAI